MSISKREFEKWEDEMRRRELLPEYRRPRTIGPATGRLRLFFRWLSRLVRRTSAPPA